MRFFPFSCHLYKKNMHYIRLCRWTSRKQNFRPVVFMCSWKKLHTCRQYKPEVYISKFKNTFSFTESNSVCFYEADHIKIVPLDLSILCPYGSIEWGTKTNLDVLHYRKLGKPLSNARKNTLAVRPHLLREHRRKVKKFIALVHNCIPIIGAPFNCVIVNPMVMDFSSILNFEMK